MHVYQIKAEVIHIYKMTFFVETSYYVFSVLIRMSLL